MNRNQFVKISCESPCVYSSLLLRTTIFKIKDKQSLFSKYFSKNLLSLLTGTGLPHPHIGTICYIHPPCLDEVHLFEKFNLVISILEVYKQWNKVCLSENRL